MCFRGCTCEQCAAQRERDRGYKASQNPDDYPSQSSIYRRASRRGLTVEQVLEMEAQRNNRCDICGKEEYVKGSTGKVKSLAIDHDHATGRIRGLLCNNCNRAIGLLGKSPGLLERALRYLKEPELR